MQLKHTLTLSIYLTTVSHKTSCSLDVKYVLQLSLCSFEKKFFQEKSVFLVNTFTKNSGQNVWIARKIRTKSYKKFGIPKISGKRFGSICIPKNLWNKYHKNLSPYFNSAMPWKSGWWLGMQQFKNFASIRFDPIHKFSIRYAIRFDTVCSESCIFLTYTTYPKILVFIYTHFTQACTNKTNKTYFCLANFYYIEIYSYFILF